MTSLKILQHKNIHHPPTPQPFVLSGVLSPPFVSVQASCRSFSPHPPQTILNAKCIAKTGGEARDVVLFVETKSAQLFTLMVTTHLINQRGLQPRRDKESL